MHELSLSMPEPMLSLSMLILATCPERAQECLEHCSALSERSARSWTPGTMFPANTGTAQDWIAQPQEENHVNKSLPLDDFDERGTDQVQPLKSKDETPIKNRRSGVVKSK